MDDFPARENPGDTAALEVPQALIEKCVLLLVAGFAAPRVEALLAGNQGIDPVLASAAVRAARGKITVAADYNRDEKLGAAVMRLEQIVAKSMDDKTGDLGKALAAQKELNKLLALYAGPTDLAHSDGADEPSPAAEELRLIGSYILPLKLIGPEYPLPEHARVAADLLRRTRRP